MTLVYCDRTMKPKSSWLPIVPERMIWTASSLKTFRNDKRKFFWKYIMRLSPIYRDRHLMVGSAFHEGIAKWYRSKRVSIGMIAASLMKAMRAEIEQNVSFYDQDELDSLDADVSTLEGILSGYVTHYESDRKELKLEPDNVETSFCIDMGDFDFAGQIDAVGDTFIVEHKTAGNPNSAYFERLVLDTQIRAYIYACQREFSKDINRVIYNVVRKPKLRRKAGESHEDFTARIRQDYLDRSSFYFHRTILPVTPRDLVNFERELRQTHAEYQAIIDTGEAHKPEAWLPNDSQCNSYFKLCPFFGMCTSGVAGGAAFVTQRATMHQELKDLE